MSSFGDGDVYKPMTACSPDRNPQVYANVPALMDWITEHTVGADVYNSNCQKIKYDCFKDPRIIGNESRLISKMVHMGKICLKV